MQYRIRESAEGFTVEIGMEHRGGEPFPGMNGATMPSFIIYESARFDTIRQAQRYINDLKKK